MNLQHCITVVSSHSQLPTIELKRNHSRIFNNEFYETECFLLNEISVFSDVSYIFTQWKNVNLNTVSRLSLKLPL